MSYQLFEIFRRQTTMNVATDLVAVFGVLDTFGALGVVG
jgi:hypothetical protein